MRREQTNKIIKDLDKKMVFLTGPRQVGKTWLAKMVGEKFNNTTYLNYDSFEDREIISSQTWPRKSELLILDELHKMPKWKNYLKGMYDTKPKELKILVTGSARLDTFRQSGDSLLGRYFLHRLLPFSLSELKDSEYSGDIDRLMERGGFPDPFLAGKKVDADRWRSLFVDGLIRTDVLDFENIHNFKSMQMVFELLRRRVGSPVSYLSIAEDVQLSPVTVKRYIEIFEALFILFRVTPFSRNIARSIIKEPKIYFFDNGLVVGNNGVKFENLVAGSLLKHIYKRIDSAGEKLEIKYLRTKEGKEVDFAVIKDNKINKLIEAKYSDNSLDNNLKYFSEKYSLSGIQVVKELKQEKSVNKIDIVLAKNYLSGL